MTLVVLEQAEKEFSKSAGYYEFKEAGLGIRFRNEVAAAVNWIQEHPEIPRMRLRGYRRVNLRVFSHYVAYVIRGSTLWVVAIAHAHQRPEFWIRRMAKL
jgi:plasmid stabilization system protein ParE